VGGCVGNGSGGTSGTARKIKEMVEILVLITFRKHSHAW
jgi:hypothetical protein